MASILSRLFGRSEQSTPPAPAKTPRIRTGRGARAEYDAATVGKRAAGWRRTLLDANAELSPAVMQALRGIARDLERNNPFAARGVSTIANNMVGTGITFQVHRNGKVDDRLNKIAREHFDKPNCDAAGRHDLYGLQLQAARTLVVGGEVLMRRRWRRASDRLPMPFQLQVLEPDYIDSSKHGLAASGGGYFVHGIQFSQIGRRTGYWLFAGHPGDARPRQTGSSFVPAADIAHVFRADRPEQERGATWLAPIVLRMKDFADYEDAQLTRQKIATSFVGFVSNEEGDGIPGVEQDEQDERLDYVEPGTFQYGRPGDKIDWSNPPGVDGYADYSRVSLRAISAGLGVPYEALTGDLSNVNFSSGRMGWLEYQRSLAAWQWTMFIPQFCGAVGQWMIEALEVMGEDVSGVEVRWTPPGREMINPSEEVKATRDAIRAGLDTISAAARRRGEDPDVFLAEWAADAARIDALKLTFDSDPRKVTAVGNPADQGAANSTQGA
ncbi:phage portal protein [Sphingomonas elodea]|uniref:phage portal protein n=1 Tax=Sphingomonas elodea TaxID=179878 RepID=UPI0018729317|nr:phage portal protein [Sphingomonas elodea]